MNIRHLQVFKAVCEEGSVTKAAKKMFMTQPAVTHVITGLEQETGCRLFDRYSRKLYLNESGSRFLDKAEKILDLFDELSNHFYESEELTPVLLGSSITAANFWLPRLVSGFSEICPRTPVKIQIDKAGAIVEKLLDHSLDMALLEGVIPSDRIEYRKIDSYTVSAYASPQHGLAGRKKISLEELARQRLLLRERGSAIRDAFDSVMLLNHLETEPVCVSVNSQALIQAAKYNMGVAVLPDILVGDGAGLVKLAVSQFHPVNEIAVAWRKEKNFTGQMTIFLELIQKLYQ